jgi:hypothetical protein
MNLMDVSEKYSIRYGKLFYHYSKGNDINELVNGTK